MTSQQRFQAQLDRITRPVPPVENKILTGIDKHLAEQVKVYEFRKKG